MDSATQLPADLLPWQRANGGHMSGKLSITTYGCSANGHPIAGDHPPQPSSRTPGVDLLGPWEADASWIQRSVCARYRHACMASVFTAGLTDATAHMIKL